MTRSLYPLHLLTRLSLVACLVFPACKPEPVTSPESQHRLYDKAWQWGRRDRLLGLSADAKRYEARLAEHQPAFEAAAMLRVLRGGYIDGFGHHPEEEISPSESDYDRVYRLGQLDAWAAQPPRAPTPQPSAAYQAGYSGQAHQYQRPY